MAHELAERLRQWVQNSNPRSPFISDVLEAARELDRLEGGVVEIGGYLNQSAPRVGDASFIVDALLAR